jgi:hypothetical protein
MHLKALKEPRDELVAFALLATVCIPAAISVVLRGRRTLDSDTMICVVLLLFAVGGLFGRAVRSRWSRIPRARARRRVR